MKANAVKETFGDIPESAQRHYVNEARATRYRPFIRPDKFEEDCQKAGLERKKSQTILQACCEASMENFEKEMHARPALYREMAERWVPRLREADVDFTKDERLEATSVTDIAAFRNFSFALIREIWPLLAPIADMVGIQSMPGPSERLFYLKTYGTDAGTFYSANWRLVNQVDTDYDEYTCGDEPNEVDLTITGTTVDALAYALLGRWDLCAEQDAMSQHQVDLNSEIASIMAAYIARAKVNRIRDNLIGSASGGTVAWASSATASSEYTLDSFGVKAWQRTLYDAITDVERLIKQKVYSNIDWVWASSDVVVRMRKANDSQFESAGDEYKGDITPVTGYAGKLNGRVTVWDDPDAAANTCLVGVSPKGRWTHTGYLIGEYIPFMVTDRFMDPADLSPRKAGITRYAEKLVNGAMFGKLNIS